MIVTNLQLYQEFATLVMVYTPYIMHCPARLSQRRYQNTFA